MQERKGCLFVEVLLECSKFILLHDATLPPRLDETKAVAHQLGEGGRDTEEAYPHTLVLQRRIDEDDTNI